MENVPTHEISVNVGNRHDVTGMVVPPPLPLSLSLSLSLTSPHGITADLLRVDDISGWDMPVEN